ncbi:hypothetical protein Tco_1153385 [Tanacetum coccineum]
MLKTKLQTFMVNVSTPPSGLYQGLCYRGLQILRVFALPFHRSLSAKPAIATEKAGPEHTIIEIYKNTTPKKHVYAEAEAEAIHMILSGIGDDIIPQLMHLEWSRFVTVIKQTADLDKESYHKLFDILKQYQNEVNELRAKKSHAPTRNRGKEIAKATTPPYESASEEDKDSDTEQAQRDKDMQKNLALIAKYIKNIYKPTNNNLETSSNTRNKNVNTSPRHKNDNQTDSLGIRGQLMGLGKLKQKRAKDYAYHKEKIMLCKREEKGIPLSAQQGDWLNDTDEESDKQELEAHYMYMAKIQEVLTADSGPTFDVEPLEQESNDIRDRCRSALHDQEIKLEKYKKYKNCQLEKEEVERKLKDTLGLLTQQKFQSDEALKTQAFETFQFKEKNDELVHPSSLEHTRYELLRKEKEQLKKDFKIRQDKDIKKLIALEHQVKFLNDDVYKRNQSIQTIHMLAPNLSSSYNCRPSFVNPKYLKKAL